MATKRTISSRKRTSKRAGRSAGKRDLVKAKNATFFAKRSARGRFTAMDEQGRSLTSDRRRKATRRSRSGYGDRGDRAA